MNKLIKTLIVSSMLFCISNNNGYSDTSGNDTSHNNRYSSDSGNNTSYPGVQSTQLNSSEKLLDEIQSYAGNGQAHFVEILKPQYRRDVFDKLGEIYDCDNLEDARKLLVELKRILSRCECNNSTGHDECIARQEGYVDEFIERIDKLLLR